MRYIFLVIQCVQRTRPLSFIPTVLESIDMHDTFRMWMLHLFVPSFVCFVLLPSFVAARPEKIRPGHAYYSDDYQVEGSVHDIVGEKNYEEVYQSYTYYEVVYDTAGRVVIFKEYKRGKVIRTEEYLYGPDGKLHERVLKRPGQPVEIMPVYQSGK